MVKPQRVQGLGFMALGEMRLWPGTHGTTPSEAAKPLKLQAYFISGFRLQGHLGPFWSATQHMSKTILLVRPKQSSAVGRKPPAHGLASDLRRLGFGSFSIKAF